jgi:hypothetical protein
MKVGDFLVRKGLISPAQLESALAAQQAGSEKKIGRLLVDAGALTNEQLMAALVEFQKLD